MLDPSGHVVWLLDRDASFAAWAGAALRHAGVTVRHVTRPEATRDPDDRLPLLLVDPRAFLDRAAFRDWIRRSDRRVTVIIVAEHLTVADAVEMMKLGVADCLVKPVSADRLCSAVRRALVRGACDPIWPSTSLLSDFQQRIAASDATVLLSGETGTGKSRLARDLHAASPRRGRTLVTLACGTLAPSLAGSELFGHVRGAFSDATQDATGRLAHADGGTLLLDDVDAAPLEVQRMLLRFLEDGSYEPVGSSETRHADVRIIATTNASLPGLLRVGAFRADLYHRLSVVTVALPPLRSQTDRIAALADRFIGESARPNAFLSSSALDALRSYQWPGNVRELKHAIERAVLLADGPALQRSDLPPAIAGTNVAVQPASALQHALAMPERTIIEQALLRNGWNRQATAVELGIDRTTLYKKMRRLGLSVSSRGRAA